MKNRLFVFMFLMVSVFSVMAQYNAHVETTTDEQQLIGAQQAREFIQSAKNLVFYLPFSSQSAQDAKVADTKKIVWCENRNKEKDEAGIFTYNVNGIKAKPGAYFDKDFTISVWVNVENVSKWSRIIDFGVGQNNSNIVFSNSASMSGIPGLAIYKGAGTDLTQIRGTDKNRLKEGEWYHLAATLTGTVARLYVNGVEIQKAENFYVPGNAARPMCLIGASNFEGESNFYGRMDELRIYNKALSDLEIKILAEWKFQKP